MRLKGVPVHEIAMQEPSTEFVRCWQAAGRHLAKQGVRDNSLKADLAPPFLEHFSFRLGNQLFYVRLEDVNGRARGPGVLEGLLAIADACAGHACLMPMRSVVGGWTPELPGWGLRDARTGRAVDPPALVSDALIEMTDWELHDFAVQVVRDWLKGEGREIISIQGNPNVYPSIWFVGGAGPEFVVVRAVRYPEREAPPPKNWKGIAESCRRMGEIGHFAFVSVANADDHFDGKSLPTPLWRAYGMYARFEGLVAGEAVGTG